MKSLIILILSLVFSPLFPNRPQILGDATTLTYPFLFTSGYSCPDVQTCQYHCYQVYHSTDSTDRPQCQEYWPQASSTTEPTPTQSPTSPYPFTFPSGYTCQDEPSCFDRCRIVFTYNETTDYQTCVEKWPNARPTAAPIPPTPTTGTTTISTQSIDSFTRELTPSSVSLHPGDTVQFKSYYVLGNTRQEENPQFITWKVLSGGGTISTTGLFKAGLNPGIYSRTVRAEVSGSSVYGYATIIVNPTTTSTASYPSPTLASTATNPSPTLASVSTSTINNIDPATTGSTAPSPGPTLKITPTPLPPPESRLSAQVETCAKQYLTKEEFDRHFAPNGPHLDPRVLGNRLEQIKTCVAAQPTPTLAPQLATCLNQQLGTDRLQSVQSTVGALNSSDVNQTNRCLTTAKELNYNQITQEQKICIAVILNTDRYKAIKAGTATPTQDEKSLARQCLGLETNVAKPPLKVEVSADNQNCLAAILGTDRYSAIKKGTSQPTAAERESTQSCFTKTEPEQAFLPPPPEQVVFLPVSKEDASIKQAQAQSLNPSTDTNILTVLGTSLPHTSIDLYIFSDPIVVSTTTDANGDWSYDLSYHLQEGDHQAYSIVNHPDKGLIRSEVFTFGVAYAADETTQNSQIIVRPQENASIRTYLLSALGIIFSATGFLTLYFAVKVNRTANQDASLQEHSIPENPPS